MGRFIHSNLSYLLGQANYALQRELEAELALAQLIGLEWRILAALHDSPAPVPAMQLAREVLEKPSTVSKALKRMQARGLVQSFSDPEDARKVCVVTSAQGTRLAKRLCAQAERLQARALARLSAKQQADLMTQLNNLSP